MKLLIDENIWLRGGHPSSLYRQGLGKMCCLGIYCMAMGVSKEVMAYRGTPNCLALEGVSGIPEWLLNDGYGGESDDAFHLMMVNDDVVLPEPYRKERIRSMFAKHGVEVEFVNGNEVLKEAKGPAELVTVEEINRYCAVSA